MLEVKTRFKGRDLNVSIGLSTNVSLGGMSQGISDFIEYETGLSINPAPDGEKFRYESTSIANMTFNFYKVSSGTYTPSLINAGFTHDELANLSQSLKKSFYLLQVYNSTDTSKQVLLHSGYYNGFTFLSGATIYSLAPSVEAMAFYISDEMIPLLTGNQAYLKLSFYNSKLGTLQVFMNQAKLSGTTEDKFYFNLTLNQANRTYTLSSSTVTAREFLNTAYINMLNENVPTFSYEKPTYPAGNSLSGNTYFESSF